MRAVVQRVSEARVAVESRVVGEIGPGLCVLLGVGREDTDADAALLADKITHLRVFGDAAGHMNLSVREVQGAVLVVSQFTLFADTRRGRRPSFVEAAPPDEANRLYRVFVDAVKATGLPVAEGVFRATMQVSLVNDGPVTLWMDTAARG
jgi:D-tyrosyl-tRNA(Tyr) deacylase